MSDAQTTALAPLLTMSENEWRNSVAAHDGCSRGNCETKRTMDEVTALRAELAERTRERDKALADYRFMVEKAADQHLPHYREMGSSVLEQIERAEAAEARLAALQGTLDTARDEIARLRDDRDQYCSDLYDETVLKEVNTAKRETIQACIDAVKTKNRSAIGLHILGWHGAIRHALTALEALRDQAVSPMEER